MGKLFGNANRYLPIQLNGTIGNNVVKRNITMNNINQGNINNSTLQSKIDLEANLGSV